MIEFAVRSPDEATFWLSLQDAGVCDAERNFIGAYAGNVQVADWGGIIPDAEGKAKPGWYCNVRVNGDVEAYLRNGLPQTDEHGAPLNVFESTRAIELFQLTEQPYDAESKFPAGYRNARGVHYADVRSISTPHNVWQ